MRTLPLLPAAPARRLTLRRVLTGSIAAVGGLFFAPESQAQSVHTWNGGGASPFDWTDATNWTGGVPDGNDLVNILGASGGILTNVYSGFASQYRLFFNSGAGSYTLNGPSLVTFFDFGGNAPKIENNASGTTQTINFAVAMNGTSSGNAAEINPVDGNLVLGSTLDLAGTTQLRVFGNNGYTLTVEGAVTSTGNSGNNTIAINQNSLLYLKGANTYNGDTFINAGELRLGNSTQGTGAVRLGDTAGAANAAYSLINNATTNAGVTIAKALEVRSGSSGVKTLGNSGVISNTLSGNITLNNPLTIAPSAGSQLRLTGIVSGTNQAITVNGAGLTALGGINTFTGQVTVKTGATLGLIPATVTLGTSSSLGNTGVGNETIVESGGTLNIGGSSFGNQAPAAANNEIFRIAGSGVGGAGALINTSAQAGTNALSKVVLTGNATISAGGNNQVSYGSGGNIITGNGRTDIRSGAAPTAGQAHLDLAGNTLTVAGNHLLALVNADISGGSFIVNAGQLNLEAGTIFNTGTGDITVNPGGKFGLWTATANQVMSVTRPVIINGGAYGDPTGTSAAFIAPSPVTITGSLNPNIVAISANLSSISGVISQSSFTGTGVDKRGVGNIGFTNIANTFSAPINIYAGILRGDYTTAIAGGVAPAAAATISDTPLGTSNTITLAGGTLNLRANFANDTTFQRWATGLNVTIDRAPGGMGLDRIANASQADKNMTLASLTITGRNAANGYSTGQGQFTFTQGNTHRLMLTNMTMNQPVALNTGDYTIDGSIFAPGRDSLQKIGGNTWGIISSGSAQEYNAVFQTGNSNIRIGHMYGTAVTNNTVTLGTGPIYMGAGSAVDLGAPTNLASGQAVELKGQLVSQPGFNLRSGTTVPDNLRATGGGLFGVTANNLFPSLDPSGIGDGTWRIGANFNGGGNGTILGVLSPGLGVVVRTGGSGTVTLSGANAITGVASHEVGSGLINGGFRTSVIGAQNGTTTLTNSNNYTGGTTVQRASTLNLQAANAAGTGAIGVFGTLALNGNSGTLATGTANTNVVTLNGGSTLLIDNQSLSGTTDFDRWGNAVPVALNAATITFNSRNNNASTTTETIGNLSYAGGSVLNANRQNAVTGNIMAVNVNSFVRTGTGTLEIARTAGTGAGFGTGQFVKATGTAPTTIALSSGTMIAPHLTVVDGTRLVNFATYDANGINNAVPTNTVNTAAFTTGFAAGNQYVYVDFAAAALTSTLGDNPDVYALKVGAGISAATATTIATGTGTSIRIRSGGLIVSGDATGGFYSTAAGTQTTINPALNFNNGTVNIEGLINIRGGTTGILNGIVTAASLTKFGGGTLNLTANNGATVTGNFNINGGTVQSTGSATANANHSPLGVGQIILAGGQWNIRGNATTGSANVLQNTGITIAQGIPIATVDVNRLDATSTNITMTINPAAAGGAGLRLEGSPGTQGQTFNLTGANGYALTIGGNAVSSLTGNVTINTASANLTMNNAPNITTANSTITKSGGNTWIVGSALGNTTAPAGTKVVLNGGTLELRSVSSFGLSANTSLELNAGTLNLRRDNTGAVYGTSGGAGTGYPVNVAGSSTISVDRVTAGSNQLLSLGATTIRNDVTLTANSGNGFGLGLDSLSVPGTGILASNIGPGDQNFGAVRVLGALSGGSLVKLGGSHLHLLAAGTIDGNIYDNAGTIRLRGAGVAGTATITVNPGATLDVNAANNLTAGQSVIVNSTPAALAMISVNTDIAHPTTGINTTNAAVGVIGLSNSPSGVYNTVINMGALYGGRWSLGGVSSGAYDPRYTATSLGVGADNLYRLGGGGTSFFLGFDAAGAPLNNVLTGGANSVRLGFDSGNTFTGTSATPGNYQFTLGGSNNYGGSTVIHRGIAARTYAAIIGGNSAFGTGAVDVFGSLHVSGNGTLADGGGNATNALTLHPGSSLVLDNFSASGQAGALAVNLGNRIANAQAINLNGSLIDYLGANNVASTETLGTVTIGGSSRIRVARNGTGTTALTITNLAGTTTAGGSLLLQTSAAAQLGLPAGDRIIASNLGTVAMVDPRVVNITDGQFVGHDAVNGFVNIVPDVNIAATTTLAAGLAPTTKVNLAFGATAGNVTLGDNPTIHSLRLDRDILNGGPFNKITLRSGGLLVHTNGVTIAPDLVFNDGTQNIEARVTATQILNIQGQITANGFTKAGAGQVFIKVPQPNYASGWTVNSGDLIFDDPTAAGQSVAGNAINVIGSTSTGGLNTAAGFGNLLSTNLGASTRVIFRWDNGTPEMVTFTGGPISVLNEATIQISPNGANDRQLTIPGVTLNSTSALSGVGVNFDIPNSRGRFVVPTLTLNANSTVRVIDSGSTGDYGRVHVLAVNSLVGVAKNLLKIGNRPLELNSDNTATFTGGGINIGQGTVVVRHDGALGSASTAVTIERNSTLEIGKSIYAPGNTSFIQNPGSSERWTQEDARVGTGGTYNLPAGVNLQVGANILNSRTIGLNGGTIEGFVYSDSVVTALQRDIETGVTLNLLADSSVGNAHLVQGATYDTGLLPNVGQPFGDTFRGAFLNIKGAITGGSFDLTKIGQDTVRISGTSNTYDDTIVSQGVLEIGADNALPAAGDLITRTGGTFDLWGFNQTVGALGTAVGYTGGGVQVGSSGRVINTGVTLKTLASNQPGDTTYNGLIDANVSLAKSGAGVLTIGNPDNSYRGTTTVAGGTLSVSKIVNGSTIGNTLTSSIGQSSSAAGNLIFSGGGLLRYTGATTSTDRQFTLGDGGGGFEANGNGPITLASTVAVTHTGAATRDFALTGGNLGLNTFAGSLGDGAAASSLTKTGAGLWVLTGSNTHTGATTVSNGTLRLNRPAADNTTIATDGNTATTSDIVINGGNLQIVASEQIGNSGSISMSSGSLGFGGVSGLTETIDKLTVTGGTFTSGANTLLVGGATVTWAGGTNTVSTGGLVSDKHWVITGGTNTVQQTGLLRVQSGTGTVGLFFGGTTSPTITLDSHATDPGELLLRQDVTVDNTLTTGTAQILSGGAAAIAGRISMDGGTRTWTINNGSATVDMLVSATLSNGALTKADTGTLKLTGNNTFTGATTINAGTLEAGAAGALGATASVTVNAGGTLLLSGSGNRVNDTTTTFTLAGGTLDSGGLSETFGVLTLTADSVIDFGAGASILTFADSSAASWVDGLSNPVTLNIWNWSGTPITGGGVDQLRFTGNGLTTTQLGQIKFYSGAGTGLITGLSGNDFVGSFGEVVPVPEPSSVATVMGLLGLIGWRERRKALAAQAAGRRA